MRPLAAGLAIAVALACTGAVLASPQFKATLEFTYSSQNPNSPSGIDSLATWSDPGEPAGKPKEIQRIKVVFHRGTRLDTSALPQCRASNVTVQRLALAACPRSTRLGTVHGKGVISTGAVFDPVATLFNGKREIIVVVMLGNRLLTNFRDDVRTRSITIKAKIPRGDRPHELPAPHPGPLPQAGRQAARLHEDAADLPGDRPLDDGGDVHLPRRLDTAAERHHTLPLRATFRMKCHTRIRPSTGAGSPPADSPVGTATGFVCVRHPAWSWTVPGVPSF